MISAVLSIALSVSAFAFDPIDAVGVGGGGSNQDMLIRAKTVELEIQDARSERSQLVRLTLEKISRHEEVSVADLYTVTRILKEEIELVKSLSAEKFKDGMDYIDPVMYAEAPIATFLTASGLKAVAEAMRTKTEFRSPAVVVCKLALGAIGLIHSYIEFSERLEASSSVKELNDRADQMTKDLDLIQAQLSQLEKNQQQ